MISSSDLLLILEAYQLSLYSDTKVCAMARHTLDTLPRELMISILECVCQLIVKELTTLTFSRRVPYGRILNQVTHLELASNLFHTLLKHYVRVDGMPVRQRLLELQMQKFTNYIESVGILGRLPRPNHWSEVAEIQKTCGDVWRNPYFRNIIPQLLNEESKLTSGAVIFFIFQLPKLFEAEPICRTASKSFRMLLTCSVRVDKIPHPKRLLVVHPLPRIRPNLRRIIINKGVLATIPEIHSRRI